MADIQLFVYSVYIPTPIDDAFLTDRMRSSQAPNTRAWFAILLLLFPIICFNLRLFTTTGLP